MRSTLTILAFLCAACAASPKPQPTISSEVTLHEPMRFPGQGKEWVEIGPGVYGVRPGEAALTLESSDGSRRHEVRAHLIEHAQHLESPGAFLTCGGADGERHLVLLLPGGSGFDSIGCTGQVMPRGEQRPLSAVQVRGLTDWLGLEGSVSVSYHSTEMGGYLGVNYSGYITSSTVRVDLYQGSSFVARLASTAPSVGPFQWNVPYLYAGRFRIRVASPNEDVVGFSTDFTINGKVWTSDRGNYLSSSYWMPSGVPGPREIVVVRSGATLRIDSTLTREREILLPAGASLIVGEGVELNVPSIKPPSGTGAGGSILNAGTIPASTALQSVSLTNSGVLLGTVHLSGNSTNSGSIEATGRVYVLANARLENLAEGRITTTLSILGSGSLSNLGEIRLQTGTISNKGTLENQGTILLDDATSFINDGTIDNPGRIEATRKTQIAQNGTLTGNPIKLVGRLK